MFPEKIDHHVHAWIKARRSAEAERVVRGFSQVGSSAVVLPITAIAATLMLRPLTGRSSRALVRR